MPTEKYLNSTGLQYFYNRIKALFASQSDLEALDAKVDDIITTGGEPNVIEVVKKNGTALTVTDKAVDVTVPTKTSDLTNDGDGTSNFATESYVSTYGGKIDSIKRNGTALPITNKAVDISVPTKTSDLTNDSNFVADASYVHTDNNFTTTLKSKLDGITAGAEPNVQPNWNQTVTTADDYIKNKPTIPTVNNGTLTIQRNGTAVATFSANQSGNATANISVPTAASEISFDDSDAGQFSGEGDVQGALEQASSLFDTAFEDIGNIEQDLSTGNYVKDASYVHTDNNFTSALKTKLEGVAAGAEVNVQSDWNVTSSSSDAYIKNKPTIPSKVSQLTNDSGFQTASQVASAISSAVASAYIYKGSVATVADLPASGNTIGDVYDVQATGVNYAWNGTAWDALGSYVDTSLYWAKSELVAITTAEIDTILAA